MKTATAFIFYFLATLSCLSQDTLVVRLDDSSNRVDEFYSVYNLNPNLKFDSVTVYDYHFSKKGKIQDSFIKAGINLKLKPILTEEYEYTYDSLNREFQHFKIEDGLRILESEKMYNSEGKLILWTFFTSEGGIFSKIFYEYDSLNNLMLSKEYRGYDSPDKPKLRVKGEYKYSNNKLIETNEYYYFNQKVDSIWSALHNNKYDSLGRKIYYKIEGVDHYLSVTSNFDNTGLLINEIIESSDNEKSIKEYSYNEFKLPYQVFWYYPNRSKNKMKRLTRYYYR